MTYSNLFKLLHLGKYERHLPLIGVWRNWLAHLPDTEGVSGSNPDIPTNIGAWCNGSTWDFDSQNPSSNLGAPTIIKTTVMIWYIILVIFIIYLLVVSGIMFFFATKFGLVNTIVQWEKKDTFYIFCPIVHLFTLYYFWTLK